MSVKFDDFLKEQLQDPEFKKEYEALQPERAIIQAIIDARNITGTENTLVIAINEMFSP